MPTRTENMGRRYNELRDDGMSAKEAVETVNREFGTKIHPGTIRRYGGEVRRNTAPEHLTTPPVDHTTPDSGPDTMAAVEDTISAIPQSPTPVVASEAQADATPDTTPVPDDTTEPKADDIPQATNHVVRGTVSLTLEELQTMRDIIHWWTSNGEETMRRLETVRVEDLTARPTFLGRKRNSGIRVNAALLDAARTKCEKPEEARRTGGSISSLIELLLWKFLDSDPQFLEEQSDSSPEDSNPKRPVDTTSMTV
ncbi:MAG: hypothetical protein V1792_07320 [Pseudomonadota bacterium]